MKECLQPYVEAAVWLLADPSLSAKDQVAAKVAVLRSYGVRPDNASAERLLENPSLPARRRAPADSEPDHAPAAAALPPPAEHMRAPGRRAPQLGHHPAQMCASFEQRLDRSSTACCSLMCACARGVVQRQSRRATWGQGARGHVTCGHLCLTRAQQGAAQACVANSPA
jgi:hypothetical protein